MASLGELERAVMDLLWAGQEAATANTLRDRLAQTSAGQGGAAGHEGKELAVTTGLGSGPRGSAGPLYRVRVRGRS